jgi:hypothetical protein
MRPARGTANHAVLEADTGKVNMSDGTNTISTGLIETPTLIQVKYTAPERPASVPGPVRAGARSSKGSVLPWNLTCAARAR